MGVSRFSVEKFLSYSAEKFSRGSLFWSNSENFRQQKKFMDKKEEEVSIFSFETFFFRLTVPKFFENSSVLCFRKIPVAKKFMEKRGWEYQVFLSKTFRLTVPKRFEGEPVNVSLTSGIEKFYASEDYVTIFCRKLFVSQYRNISQRNPSVQRFRKVPVAKKFRG